MEPEAKVIIQITLLDDGLDTLNFQSTSKNDITNLGMLQRAAGLINLRNAVKDDSDQRIHRL